MTVVFAAANGFERHAESSCPTNRLSYPHRRGRRPRRPACRNYRTVKTRSSVPSAASRTDGACPIPTTVYRKFSVGRRHASAGAGTTEFVQTSSSVPIREALNKSARAVGERFCRKLRFESRRNTLCISRFSNRKVAAKDPPGAAADLFRDSLDCHGR